MLIFITLLYIGFAFIYMEDERDADDAIRGLDRTEFGRKGRRLRVEWTKVMHLLLVFVLISSYISFCSVTIIMLLFKLFYFYVVA